MPQRSIPDLLFGITLEDVEDLSQAQRIEIIDSLEHFHF